MSKKALKKAIKNYVLFSNEEFKINSLKKLPLSKFSVNINQTIKFTTNLKKRFYII